MAELLLGQTLAFDGNPMTEGMGVARHDPTGAILSRDGRIADMGDGDTLRQRHPRARVTDYGRALISAGFVDAHAHGHAPPTGTRLARNWSAEACQERPSAKRRQAARERVRAVAMAVDRSSLRQPTAGSVITSSGPGTG